MSEEEDEEEKWSYASGLCVCPTCGKLYFDHPKGGPVEWLGRQYLTRLCDGRLVKL